jgi:hypothetical protein
MEENIYTHWVKANAEYLSLRKIEVKLNIPESTLRKFVAEDRPLPEKYHKPIEKWVKALIKDLPR